MKRETLLNTTGTTAPLFCVAAGDVRLNKARDLSFLVVSGRA
jgi:hypothetical protein